MSGSADISLPPAAGAPVGSRGDDQLDPELLALPDPPRRERTWTVLVLAVTALASLAMVFALRRDAAYAFAEKSPAELGDLRVAALDGPGAGATANGYVRAHGLLGGVGSIRYERPFESDSYRLAPVAGRGDVWVELRVPLGEESARYVPPSNFAGRLVPFDDVGPRHRGLRDALAGASGATVPAKAWLLVDGEAPEGARWAVALIVLFLGFAVWNVLAIARLVRRVDA